jgi:predicted RNase H-like HicB family nuclease
MAQSLISAKSGAREITLTVQIWREDGAYVAYAPELDVSSCGNSLRQSKARLRQAVGLFLEEAARRGTLENILATPKVATRRFVYGPEHKPEKK